MVTENIEQLIGNTPLIRLNRLSEQTGTTILAKCEFLNPTGSVKDRIAAAMINQAIARGTITPHTMIIEPTSGNTGIGLAAICASKGLSLIIVMPDSMSIERRKLMTHLGAKLVLTPASDGMQGSIDKAHALCATLGDGIVLQQFENPDNPEAHRTTTAIEILRDTNSRLDIFVSAVGTGGTITGNAEVLKKQLPHLHVVAVEPSASPLLSGGEPGSHAIQGIGAGFIPEILNRKIIDEIITISDGKALALARQTARDEGLLIGISSGANIAAVAVIASRPENRGKTIVTILPDSAERYLSTELFEAEGSGDS